MFCADVNADWKADEMKRLKKAQERYVELRQHVEDRNIENLADLAEMQYLEYEMNEIVERIRLEKIQEQNEKLSVIAKIAPPA
jgi:hypothetical protein